MVDDCCAALLKNVKNKQSPVIFTEKQEDGYMSNLVCLSWKHCKIPCLYEISFCPWCGDELEQAQTCYIRDKLSDSGVANAYIDTFDFTNNIPEALQYLKNRAWYEEELTNRRKCHKNKNGCGSLEYALEEDVPVVYMANIRTYGILLKRCFKGGYWLKKPKAEYCDFEPIDYCPFCGAKFPDRLDEKLTKILRSEYGLDSWKDYKKAPKEFQTDEWWKKRGL
jgi:hypothetical protein